MGLKEEQQELVQVAAIIAASLVHPLKEGVQYSNKVIARKAVELARAVIQEVNDSSTD